jgi:hypothetical protein
MMRTELVNITPAMAREFLKSNNDNRDFRVSHAAELYQSFMRGEYVTTHQGISFDITGRLRDGQHRLHAIAKCPDSMVFPMLVTRGQSLEAYQAIDVKIAVRGNFEVLGIDKALGQVGNFMARFVTGEQPTPPAMAPYAEFAEPFFGKLLKATPRHVRTWSSAASRMAAILSMSMGKDEGYVVSTYFSLVTKSPTMPPIAWVLFKQHEAGKVRCHKGWFENDFVARLSKVYDPALANATKLVVPDYDVILAPLKAHLNKMVPLPDTKSRTVVRRLFSDPSTGAFP